MDKLVLELRFY